MKRTLSLFLLIIFSGFAYGQDDLMKELEKSDNNDINYSFQTFKGTRLVNGHTVETKPKNSLEFIFAHRFGRVKGGIYELFGLDDSQVRIGLDYGLTDNMSVSIGRNSDDKTVDGFVKYKLIRQRSGASIFPVTITALGGVGRKPFQRNEFNPDGFKEIDRYAYVGQLLIARKFTPNLSLQIMPTFIHRNLVAQDFEYNDQLAVGFGGRIKLTKSVAVTSEYYYRINTKENDPYHNVLGVGIDIETGGHVFQIVITNTRGLTERAFIAETANDFAEGDVHLGFNVTRTFHLKPKK